jgi:hypothetical protein
VTALGTFGDRACFLLILATWCIATERKTCRVGNARITVDNCPLLEEMHFWVGQEKDTRRSSLSPVEMAYSKTQELRFFNPVLEK